MLKFCQNRALFVIMGVFIGLVVWVGSPAIALSDPINSTEVGKAKAV
jgi:hypothetical protein